jgi:hypothetical protein
VTWEPALVADGLANLFGAGGALVVAAEADRADPRGPVTRRIVFALRFVAAFFLIRALAWLTDNNLADALAILLASYTPLVSLIVAEGLLRRHGPRWLKAALCAAPALVAATRVLPFIPPSVPIALLLATVVIGFCAVGLFLWLRDVKSLTLAENATVSRLLVALALLAPLIATDFRSIWPAVPVRLGALGALLVLYVGLGSGSAQASMEARLANIGVFLAIATVVALGHIATIPASDFDQLVRACVVGLAGLMFAALFSEAQGARAERNRAVVPLVEASTAAEFAESLRCHPLLGDARILDSGALDHARHPALLSLLSEQRILRLAASPWGRSNDDNGVERAVSLMTAYDATHLLLLTREPLRLIAVAVPAVAADTRTDSEIQIARRIGELVYAREDAM